MPDRMTSLMRLAAGDIFHAEAPNGASYVCLVLDVKDRAIQARRVTTQEMLVFDRHTGTAQTGDGNVPCTITSVAPLPAEIHDTFLALDNKYKALMEIDEKDRFKDPGKFALSAAEKKALLFIDEHYSANPLPPASA